MNNPANIPLSPAGRGHYRRLVFRCRARSARGPMISALCDHSADNPDASIPACTRLLDAARNETVLLPAIYNNRGVAWVRKGLYANAIDDFNAAIQYDPNYVKPTAIAACLAHERGIRSRARRFQSGDQARCNSAPLTTPRGATLLNKGEFDRARSISTRPSSSTRFMPRPTITRGSPSTGAGIRSRDRGFRPGHRARAQVDRGL